MPPEPTYSAIIPVYNSAEIVEETIAACAAFFEEQGLAYEIVAVNDGSRDASWQVLRECAARYPRLVILDLLRNYGQHTAVLCGFEHARGSWVVTLDDDLQNPPGEVAHLIRAAERGHDAVFGSYLEKKHGPVRRLGSRLVDAINNRIFRKPPNLLLTNFRLLERSVVQRILAHRTRHPYINGLSALYARNPANVPVEHHPRRSGSSGYSPAKILELVARILFNYSSYPLRLVSLLGLVVSLGSFVLGAVFLVRALVLGSTVPGWASLAIMLSFFNGISLLLLGMLGEYVGRILQEVGGGAAYHVAEMKGRDE